MESRLMQTCRDVIPPTNSAALVALSILGGFFGIFVGVLLGADTAPAGFVACVFGFPLVGFYLQSRDVRLSDDDCKRLLDAAESSSEQALVKDAYCKNGCLMASDAKRILEQLQAANRADVDRLMGCAE